MSGLGTGYDLSCTTFSPDGRVFQVDYALKAVENSGTAVGLRVKDGVVFGVEKLIVSKMLEPTSNRRIFNIDRHIGLSFAGLQADARQLVNRARLEAKNYRNFYQDDIPGHVLAERMAAFMQAYTLYSHMRPFGCSIMLSSVDRRGPQLFMIEPSGISYSYYGTSIGKAKQAAKGEIEKLKLSELTAREAVAEVAKIIYQVHDEVKDKEFELELSWICPESKNRHEMVPKEIAQAAEAKVKAELEEAMVDED
eukprot:TRINITY_DN3652_c0_g1_i4.p1 TRINITY_DN3652_c0_g1~~TRINITY_DN3652_c0_g1_i4.p1  ORF type:complete len:252 (+),score=69.13 TRINITY_DN3652_c0_g1_i4:79-834(+)